MISNVTNLYARRGLLRELTLSELRRQTSERRLGWTWWLLDPLIMMLIYWAIVVGIFGRGERYTPYAVFLLCALLPFKHFTESVARSCNVLRSRDALIKSVPFPTIVLPISIVLSGFAMFFFGLIVLFAASFVWDRPLTLALVQLPALMALHLILVTGICLIVSCLGAMFLDFTSIVSHGTRVLFYCSPTLYGIDLVHEQARKLTADGVAFAEWIPRAYMLNPFASLIT